MRRQPQLLWRRAPRQKAGWRSLQPVPVAVPRGAGRARSSPQPPGKAQGSAPAPAVPGCTGQGALTASASMLGVALFQNKLCQFVCIWLHPALQVRVLGASCRSLIFSKCNSLSSFFLLAVRPLQRFFPFSVWMCTELLCMKDLTVLTKNGLNKKALHLPQSKDQLDLFSP